MLMTINRLNYTIFKTKHLSPGTFVEPKYRRLFFLLGFSLTNHTLDQCPIYYLRVPPDYLNIQ